ncbi:MULTISPECIES: quinone oxidoreductase family protein [Micrococcaceae]|uniref:quinone oxidoreductase family protein n=1 Tax=unclassified Kocuria TaxID=2649579 RepID=UPI00101018D6|nr:MULTISPECIES: quinone oxidoreductase [unclassified Kocuria]
MTTVVAPVSGGPQVLVDQQAPVPDPSATQLLVRNVATGVNFIETYQRSGVYDVKYPFTPGSEAVGVVVAAGSSVTHARVGDRIATSQALATYSEYFLVEDDKAVKLPEGIDPKDAACLPLQGVTAHYLVRSTYPVSASDTVLFHAGAGGVGGLAIQLIKNLGAKVIATVSTDEKEEIARRHGADHVVRYEHFADEVRELTDGRGVDVVYDSVGKATFEDSLTTLRPRGVAVLFGGASGQVPPFDLQRLNAMGSLYVTRPSIGAYLRDRRELEWRMSELFDDVLAGRLKVSLDATFALAEAARAHQYLEDRKTRGKVLLQP